MSRDCPVCQNSYKNKRGVKQHCGRAHDDKDNPFKVERLCKECDEIFYLDKWEFERDVVTGDFCSSGCQGKYERNGTEFDCINCGDSFYLAKSRLSSRSCKYCSLDCLSEYNSVNKQCNYCGDKFSIGRNQDLRRNWQHCSNECRNKSGRETYICNYCDSKFTKPKTQRVHQKTYCSNNCYYQDKFQSGNLRKKSEYDTWRDKVFKKCNNRCKECGSDKNLHAHHIIPISEDSSLAFDVDNGIALCVSCHADKHEGEPVENLIRSRKS